MSTMPIDGHPLTQRRLQFIGIGVNKLTFKSIIIINRQTTTAKAYYRGFPPGNTLEAFESLYAQLQGPRDW